MMCLIIAVSFLQKEMHFHRLQAYLILYAPCFQKKSHIKPLNPSAILRCLPTHLYHTELNGAYFPGHCTEDYYQSFPWCYRLLSLSLSLTDLSCSLHKFTENSKNDIKSNVSFPLQFQLSPRNVCLPPHSCSYLIPSRSIGLQLPSLPASSGSNGV